MSGGGVFGSIRQRNILRLSSAVVSLFDCDLSAISMYGYKAEMNVKKKTKLETLANWCALERPNGVKMLTSRFSSSMAHGLVFSPLARLVSPMNPNGRCSHFAMTRILCPKSSIRIIVQLSQCGMSLCVRVCVCETGMGKTKHRKYQK